MAGETVADRVIALRKLLGYNEAKDFAENFLGISNTRWGHVETGKPLSRQMAFLLVEKIDGLTLDWIYFGSRRGLDFELGEQLQGRKPPPRRK